MRSFVVSLAHLNFFFCEICDCIWINVTLKTFADTYVKTYLRENDRWLQKRKTRVVRHNCNPEYNQTLRYSACDVLGRSLLVMLWERQKGFEHNQGLGGAEVTLDALKLTQVTEGWYPLFPIQSLGSDSNDSPWRLAFKCRL